MKKALLKVLSVLVIAWIIFQIALHTSTHHVLQSNVKQGSSVSATQPLTLLDWAERLIVDLKPKNNAYGSNPTYIEWKDIEGVTVSKNRTVCSSFITRLLKQTYGYKSSDIEKWMGTANPQAATYYNTIAKQNGFQLINNVKDVQPGDLLAIKYLENAQTQTDESEPDVEENLSNVTQCPKRSTVTGHIVLVREVSVVRQFLPPIQKGLTQYSLKVIDSSSSGHGCQDTRLLPNKSCSNKSIDKNAWGNGGAGQGNMRLYVIPGAIVGYTWSLRDQSTYYVNYGYKNEQGCDIPGHPLLIGRLLNKSLR